MIAITDPTCAKVIGEIRARTKICLIAREARSTASGHISLVEINRLLEDHEPPAIGEALKSSLKQDGLSVKEVHVSQRVQLIDGANYYELVIVFQFHLPKVRRHAA